MVRHIVLLLWLVPHLLFGQGTGQLLPTMVVRGDTFPVLTLDEVVIVSKRYFASAAEQYRFQKLKRDILLVYPYAKEAAVILRQVHQQMAEMDGKKERKRFLKQKERELETLYSHSLKNMTVTQGDLLVKLIARETGLSVYSLLEELKTPLSAFYWNRVSSFFGYSLKQSYDPQEQRDIEIIVRSIEGSL